jgi:hypothetical protein
MALFLIPTNPNQDNYQFSIVISGILYFLDIIYNVRTSRYTLNILDSDKVSLVSGLPILTNVPLTNNFKYLEIPPGDFIALSPSDNENAELGDLGDKVELYYND